MEGDPGELGIAFFEYCLQVPANRIGAKTFSPDQLKVIQEVITLTVFRCVFDVLLWRQAALEPLCSLWLPGGGGVLYVSQVLAFPGLRVAGSFGWRKVNR